MGFSETDLGQHAPLLTSYLLGPALPLGNLHVSTPCLFPISGQGGSWRQSPWRQGELLVPQVFPLESSSPSWVVQPGALSNAENPAGDTSGEGTQWVATSPNWAPNGVGLDVTSTVLEVESSDLTSSSIASSH